MFLQKRNIKICIVGNSVAMRVRPHVPYPGNLNYHQYLEARFENSNARVVNLSYGATTIKNVTQKTDVYVREFPDVYIINLGVVDACSREVPLWFYRMATSKNDRCYNNFANLIYRNVIAKFRRPLTLLRFKKPWVSVNKFKQHYSRFINDLLKETNAVIVILPINIANKRIEKQLPGSQKRQHKINAFIQTFTDKPNCFVANINDLVPDNHYPDGVHYSVTGHKIIADRIYAAITQNLSKVNHA